MSSPYKRSALSNTLGSLFAKLYVAIKAVIREAASNVLNAPPTITLSTHLNTLSLSLWLPTNEPPIPGVIPASCKACPCLIVPSAIARKSASLISPSGNLLKSINASWYCLCPDTPSTIMPEA